MGGVGEDRVEVQLLELSEVTLGNLDDETTDVELGLYRKG